MSTLNPPRTLKHIRAALNGEPWAILPSFMEQIAAIVEVHVAGEPVAFQPKQKQWLFGKPDFIKVRARMLATATLGGETIPISQHDDEDDCEEYEPYSVVDGVALLPLQGPLFPKANILTMYSGATSYQEVGAWLSECVEREDVNAIVICADSPGGYCKGCAELADQILATRELKPIVAHVTDACSAALHLVSQCESVWLTQSSRMGSCGVVGGWSNADRAERNAGIDGGQISTSSLKLGNMPETTLEYMALVDSVSFYFGVFKEALQRGRPDLEMSKVDGAQIFIGKQCVEVGLADGIKPLDQIIAELSS